MQNCAAPALNDLDAIADYIAHDNPAAASELVQQIFRHVDQLMTHSDSGSKPRELRGGGCKRASPRTRESMRTRDAFHFDRVSFLQFQSLVSDAASDACRPKRVSERTEMSDPKRPIALRRTKTAITDTVNSRRPFRADRKEEHRRIQ
jgi:plasmid stabilization system protein ParE